MKEILGLRRGGLLRPRRRARVLPRGRHPWRVRRARRGSSAARAFSATETGDGRRVRRLPRAARASPGGRRSCPTWDAGEEIATRQACAAVVNAVLDVVPGLLCGGADLTENTGMELKDARSIATPPLRRSPAPLRHPRARHGLGDERHGGERPAARPAARSSCSATTCAAAVRLAALSHYKTAFVWTHDSVGLGEDGPTHQPVEQLAVAPGDARAAGDPPGRCQRGVARPGGCTSTATARPR